MIDIDALSTLRADLHRLKIVDNKDWEKAERRVGAGKVTAVLEHLRKQNTGTIANLPKSSLTSYMIDKITRGLAHELRFKHFVIMRMLGEGGMGAVYQVRNLNGDIVQALKLIKSDQIANERIKQRFVLEATNMAKLKHPGIPQWYEANFDGPEPYIAIEFCAGRTLGDDLQDRLKDRPAGSRAPLTPWREAVLRVLSACEPLNYAHKKGLIHRDIKPANMMLSIEDDGSADEVVKILDLGIAKLKLVEEGSVGDQTNATHNITSEGGNRLGTPAFMPPEQWVDAAGVTPAADVYSLGVTFHYMLTGDMPFRPASSTLNAWMQAHFHDKPFAVSSCVSGTPKQLDAILLKMLAKKPDNRYADAGAVKAALLDVLERNGDKKGLPAWMLATGGVGAAAAVAATVYLSFQGTGKPTISTVPTLVDPTVVDPTIAKKTESGTMEPAVDAPLDAGLIAKIEIRFSDWTGRHELPTGIELLKMLREARAVNKSHKLPIEPARLTTELNGLLDSAIAAAVKEKKYDAAVDLLKQAEVVDPMRSASLKGSYGKVYLAKGRDSLAAAKSDPDKYGEAVASFDKAAEVDQSMEAEADAQVAAAYIAWGAALKAKNPTLAFDKYLAAVELQPIDAASLRDLIDLGRTADRTGDAELLLGRLLNRDDLKSSLKAEMCFIRGGLRRDAKEYPGAVADFNAAVKLDPEKADYKSARDESYKEFIASVSKNPEVKEDVADVLKGFKNLTELDPGAAAELFGDAANQKFDAK
ncbi:MAG: protein kinase domain-containing protein, partial [Planctomycetia bacterium]